MIVCTKSRSELATERMRSVASACVIVKAGPKNTAARNVITANDRKAGVRPPDRYATNWNGTILSVAMAGTHRYQRLSLVRTLSLSDRYPPRKVPSPPTAAKRVSQLAALVAVIW